MDHRTRKNPNVKPSSEERLARWARALHTAQSFRPANQRPQLDHDEFLRRILLRAVSEAARGGGSLFLCRAIRNEFGAESVEWRDAGEVVKAFIVERDQQKFLTKLRAEWASDFVSLSGAVWWIASQGGATDWDDKLLEGAAKELMGELSSDQLVAFGVDINSATILPDAVPSHCFSKANPFVSGASIEQIFSDAAVLSWGLLVEKDWRIGEGDTIKGGRRGGSLWKRLCVKRVDLHRKWPVAASTPNAEDHIPLPVDDDNVELEAGKPLFVSVAHTVERRRGAPPTVLLRVLAAMRRDIDSGDFDVANEKEEAMASRYGASRDTCRRARDVVLQNVEN